MTIKNILSEKKVSLSFEIFPPKKQDGFETVANAASELSKLTPDFMSITYGAGGSGGHSTVDIAKVVMDSKVPALAHLTCVGNTMDSIQNIIGEMKSAGIENVLALRGDIPNGVEVSMDEGLYHASNLIPILKEAGFCVGGACYPEGHPESHNRQDDLENMRYKVDAGADFLTTQMFFDNDMLYSYLYRLQSIGIHVPVLAGIMPITTASQVNRMVKLSGAYIPSKLLSLCDKFSDKPEAMYQAGINYAVSQIVDLISNGVRGIHIYTMNRPQVARDILRNAGDIIKAVNEK
ncbi:MAG: methylenetetrahydrofolate reductase [NAD(P)H] [Treponema sp.]|nr:methylenetetrahydrofolate reductase [NAD(P)H] [Treponema sp.]